MIVEDRILAILKGLNIALFFGRERGNRSQLPAVSVAFETNNRKVKTI